MKRLIAFIGFILSFVPNAVLADSFDIQDFYLKNGLQVVVLENHKAPIVKQMLFYKVGAADEKKGKGGIAHLLEHLMFRGTTKVKSTDFNKLSEKNGVESNAFTSQDVTAYHQLADISKLELLMLLEADRMQNLKLNEDDFVTERDIVFQERKQRVDNNPSAKFFEMVNNVLWQEHPYANPVTGYDDEIMGLSKDDALDFYNNFYVPNNALLVLAGDIDVITAKKLAEKYYGKLKRKEVKSVAAKKLTDNYKAQLEVELPGVKLGRLLKIAAVPSFGQDVKKAFAFEVLSSYLGGDENSPLYQKLVLREKNALSVSAYYEGINKSYGKFVFSMVPTGKPDLKDEKYLLRAFDFAMNNFNEAELENVKNKMLAELDYAKDNPESFAMMVGWSMAIGVKPDVLRNYAQNIKQVTIDDVREAADFVRNKAPSVVGMLYPEEVSDE